MRIGTKSLLFGAHLFWWHPWFVALAWYKLYGWKEVEYGTKRIYGRQFTMRTSLRDWRLWLAFLVHDWGYWGRRDMDGMSGTFHPLVGSDIMYKVTQNMAWGSFMLYHSRAMANRHFNPTSPLAAADKLSLALEPWWFYLFRVRLTGEIREYQSTPRHVTEHGFVGYDLDLRQRTWSEDKAWWLKVRQHLQKWARENSSSTLPSSNTTLTELEFPPPTT